MRVNNIQTNTRPGRRSIPDSKQHGRKAIASVFTPILFTISSILLYLAFDDLSWQLLIVITLSASLAASDAVEGIVSRRDLLSPRVAVSLLLVNAVYVSPILHIILKATPKYIPLPVKMEDAVYDLAIIHLLGVFVYFIGLRFLEDRKVSTRAYVNSASDEKRFMLRLRSWLIFFGVISFTVFAYIVLRAGGPMAWISVQLNYRTELESPGWLLVTGAGFPMLFFIAYAISLKLKSINMTRGQVAKRIFSALIILILVIFLTSGLRGSRANLIWPALTAVLLIHLLFIRIKGKWIVLFAILGLIFAGAYDVYKKIGTEGISQLQAGTLEDIDSYSELGFGPQALLLGDFSRTAIQSVLLDHWNTAGFDLNWGRTYIGDALDFVPGAERSTTFPNKQYAATEILYGQGAAEARPRLSTRIYGLQGEALINFGPIGAVLAFLPYAFVMVAAERSYSRALKGHSMRSGLVIALMIPIVILLFLSDMDNVVNNFASKAMFPILAIVLAGVPNRKGINQASPVLPERTGR